MLINVVYLYLYDFDGNTGYCSCIPAVYKYGDRFGSNFDDCFDNFGEYFKPYLKIIQI